MQIGFTAFSRGSKYGFVRVSWGTPGLGLACRLLSQVAGISGPDHGNTNAAEAIILAWAALCF